LVCEKTRNHSTKYSMTPHIITGEEKLKKHIADRAGWQPWLPGLDTLRRYEAAWLRHDLVAGLVLATMLVPVGIAYAVGDWVAWVTPRQVLSGLNAVMAAATLAMFGRRS